MYLVSPLHSFRLLGFKFYLHGFVRFDIWLKTNVYIEIYSECTIKIENRSISCL